MTNHPLNTVRYADLAGILRMTLRRVNEYLDLAIEIKQIELEDLKDSRKKAEEKPK